MVLDMHILENYIQHKQLPDQSEWFYTYTNGYHECANHRQDVAAALCDTLCNSILQFPYFNTHLVASIFKDELVQLHNVIVMPIIASSTSFDCKLIEHENTQYLLIDILNIADYTTLLNEMQYILQNQISLNLITHMIHLRHPKQDGYVKELEDNFFCNGLAQYLSWNEDCAKYPFHEANYQKRMHNAYALFHKFYVTEDLQLQDNVRKLLKEVEFWNCFPMVYGILFFHDVFVKKKELGLYELFVQGPSILRNLLLQS